MNDDAIYFDFEIRRRPEPEKQIAFTCIACGHEVRKPRFHWENSYKHMECEPLCNGCTRHWGCKVSGPVFNRRNFHTLKQLSAAINMLQWEIRNGNRQHRR
jgi:hypothetical protein